MECRLLMKGLKERSQQCADALLVWLCPFLQAAARILGLRSENPRHSDALGSEDNFHGFMH
eukprot:1020577-Pelagomonas_calceolata.AAC.1